jgi:hypothetical protein
MAEAQKGVFDHLAEYLLHPPEGGPTSPPAATETQPPAEAAETLPAQPEGPPPATIVKGGETLVFVETAEKLVVEKEAFVREEVVLRKMIENRVQEIDDTVRRTEVEVQRLAPEEAERIEPAVAAVQRPPSPEQAIEAPTPVAPVEVPKIAAEAPPPAPKAQPARPMPSAVKQTPRSDERSASWWLWFALILCAGVLIAFAAGQFLGSASG